MWIGRVIGVPRMILNRWRLSVAWNAAQSAEQTAASSRRLHIPSPHSGAAVVGVAVRTTVKVMRNPRSRALFIIALR